MEMPLLAWPFLEKVPVSRPLSVAATGRFEQEGRHHQTCSKMEPVLSHRKNHSQLAGPKGCSALDELRP